VIILDMWMFRGSALRLEGDRGACAGMGLIMVGGYHSYGPGGFRESPLADVLP
jgi:hypothetical protein